MSTEALLSKLRCLGVTLRADGGRLRFDAPAGVLTEALRDELRARKSEILDFLDQAIADRRPEAPPIVALPRDRDLPLSFAQQRLWFLDQLYPGRFGYNQALALRLRGELDGAALEQGLDELIRRHEPLRTALRAEDGVPRQEILDPQPRGLPLVDLTDRPVTHREAAARQLAVEEMKRPFDLSAGRPMRAQLLRLDDRDHVLLLTLHHIVSDGWSLGVLHRELAAIYAAFVRGEPSPLAPLAVQYADFAGWQRQWLSGSVWEEQLRYWKTQLADVAPLELPTDRPRPAEQTFEAALERLVLPKRLAEAIDALGRQENATPFMTMLAAFTVVLRRYSGQDDIVVGSPIANRNRIEIEPLIGFFVNSLVMRTDLSGRPTFRELVSRVRRSALGAYAHQDIPFEHLVEELHPERDLSRSPLFQVLFAVQNADSGAFALPGLEVSTFQRDVRATRFDLELHVTDSGDGSVLQFVYNTDLFDTAMIERMARHYRRLLENAVADPDRPIDALALMDESERRELVVARNRTEAHYAEELTVPELVRRTAAGRPDDVAVVFEGTHLTYGQLEARAEGLARHLVELGVGRGDRVGLCVDRSPEMLVGLLGVQKTGAAYVPLDPGLPEERLRLMLEDADVSALVTTEAVRERVAIVGEHAAGLEAPLVRLDADLVADGGPAGAPLAHARPDDVAYVIYTSGSTGRPKGVEVLHRGVVNFLESMRREPGFSEDDVLLAVTTLSFDIAVLELLLPLVTGGTVVIAPAASVSDGEAVGRLLDEHDVTVMQATPATWQLLLQSGWKGRAGLKMLCGGEALPWPLADALLELGGELWNMYGPTETTIWSATMRVERGLDASSGPVSIGQPIANTQLYVLDAQGQLVPDGAIGELCIGGHGLARGYWKRPELTAERFVPTPFEDGLNARLYRTGDLVRYDVRGRLHFLGRTDHQVKLRGFRIELGEIESALVGHPAVEQAAVLLRDVGAGDQRLVGYFVGGPDARSAALRAHLAATLPDYMVPGTFVHLDSLPLSPAGKIDRKALAAVPVTALATDEFVAPRRPTEEAVAALFAELLECERVGAHDGFFDLGGHSLLGAQLIARLRKVFEIDLPLSTLFESPTVAGLADRVDAARGSGRTAAGSVALVPISRDLGDLPLSFAQQRLWFLDQLGAGSAYNMRFAMRLAGRLDVAAMESALDAIFQRHEVLRTSFPSVDGNPVQRIDATLELPFESIDLRDLDEAGRGQHAQRLVDEEVVRAFDLEHGPLVRFQLYRLDDDDQVLLVIVHHIIFDGWSTGVFKRELSELYRAFAAGEPPALDDLPLQYADFAAWQHDWMEGEALDELLGYWCARLGPDVPELELPADRSRPAVQSFEGGRNCFDIPPDLHDAVQALCQHAGVTPAMTLLAVFSAMLARYTRQDEIVVGSPIANRNYAEIEGLLGFFVNALVLRTDVSGDPSFSELLARVRSVSLGAYDHQDLPFERLVEELDPERDLSRSPLFQVMFAMQNTPPAELVLPGVEVRPFDFGVITTRFDLEVHVNAAAGGLRVHMVYAKQLFDCETIERMGRHFVRLLEEAVEHPERSISQLPLLDSAECRQVVSEWNDTATDYPSDRCVHALVEEQVARRPDAVAVEYGGAGLTYGDLDGRANQVARHLQRLGVRRGTMVGVCLDRSEAMVVAMLGILKAGGTYVPLDPAYPAERLRFMLEDTAAPVVLTVSALAELLDAPGTQLVCLDIEADVLAAHPTTPPATDVSAGDTAYVIYTSGSTGRAKGVCVPHRAINRLVVNTDYIRIRDTDRIAQASNANFDAATFEIWGALIHGARLVGVVKDVLLSAPLLAEQIRDRGINVMFVTTALFNELVREIPDIFAGFRYVLFGGQAVDPRWPRDVLSHGGPEHLLHVYGPTETTTFATWHEITDVAADATTIPIGRGLANTTTYVVDARMNPVPVGVAGELYIGGPGVATDYLGRPSLTAESYVPDPFGETPGARLYRTGDLVRWTAEGSIEFIGRVDHQVKLRGFRIELGEIESALTQHDAVNASVVTVHEEASGDKRLVSYVVPELENRDAVDVDRESGDRVDQWQRVYDDVIYKDIDEEPAAQDDPRFNIVGWKSTYSGEPLGADEMREQVDQTVARMLEGKHDRVLEIGCGTGLLLFPVAPQCQTYWGTDFSRVALDYVREQLGTLGAKRPDVRLSQRLADDFTGVEENAFDLAVINSVAQYFPSIDYLDDVLVGAIRAIAPGGRILIGDVRSLPLLETFLTSVEMYQGDGALTADQLQQRVHQKLIHEQELAVDPEYFVALREREPRISHVQILLKRGRASNELTKYRYDVILHIASSAPTVTPESWSDWEQDELSLPAVRRRLAEVDGPVAIRRVPNARISEDLALMDTMHAGKGGAVMYRAASAGIDPAELWSLGEKHGYEVTIGWSDSGPSGRFDVVFTKRTPGVPPAIAVTPLASMTPRQRDLHSCGTNPLRAELMARLIPDLRAYLVERLPEYMMPSVFVLLDALPLTPNGKVDRRALPAPDAGRPELSSAYEAPRTPVEQRLAEIWSEVLGLERVGIHDDFFELGGHSLLATQIVSRARETFGLEIPLQALFDNATIEDLAGFVQGAEAEALKSVPIVPLPRDGDLPLSFAQQRLWFLDQLYPGRFGYNQPLALRLRGELDGAALEQGLDELIRRHEPLRTALRSEDGVPRQVILDPQPRGLPLVDLTDRPVAQREGAARQLAVEEMKRPFDLSAGMPMRAQLLRLDDRDHVLLLTLHHIVSDGWSLGVLHRELAAIYAAFVRGEPSPLAPLAVQYADFAGWQRQWLSGSVWEEQLRYWKTQLADVAPLELPTDRPRPAEQTFEAALERLVLPKRLAEAIDALGRQENATPFMTMLAAFTVVLRRYSGQDDIVVGSPIANRNRIEIEPLIGFFVNSLVMRTDLSGRPTFRELVSRVRRSALGAYAHQDIPFEHLVEELHPERDLSRSPLFQVLFAVQNADSGAFALPGLEVSTFQRDVRATRFDLELHVTDSGDGSVLQFVYNTDLFDTAMIERMARHYRRLLENAVADPDRPIDALALMDESERRELVVARNRNAEELTVPELVRRSAAGRPDDVAVVFEGTHLTYGQLEARAEGLARHLVELGVGRGDRVGLCVDRSPEMLVGLLGVQKAGAAYVPLDPELPEERLRLMLEDADVSALVTTEAVRERVAIVGEHAAGLEAPLVRLDADLVADGGPAGAPLAHARPDDVAYVIYTSGSTGRPKGVEVLHRGVVNFLESMRREPGFSEDDVLLAVTTLSFDIAVLELLLPLVTGGTVVIAPAASVSDGEAVGRLLDEHDVTVMQATPATWQLLLQSGWKGRAGLKMLCGGEALPWPLADALLELGGELWNMYGPTETTIWSATIRVEPDPDPSSGPVSIGGPIANTQLYVLDADAQLVPVGAVGELCIGGDGVARGYWKRPEMTAERFVPDPFKDGSEARIYRTGDLVRYDARGRLQFLGRTDHQVKLRGFRIELGEIESTLVGHPEVEQAAVLLRDDGAGDQRLVAYLVGGRDASPVALRAHLAATLPDYMVPGAFVHVDAMPLSPAGKIDRKALAGVAPTGLATSEFVAPRGPTEEAAAALFAELLDCDRVGAHDGFFDLGGHSLLGTRLIARLRKVFEIDLALSVLFESPTVAGLAERVDVARGSGQTAAGSAAIVPIARDSGELPLSFAEQRLWFLHQMDTGAGYNMPSAIRATGVLDVAALEWSLASIAQRHEVLRTTFPTVEGAPRVTIAAAAALPLAVIDRTGLPVEEREAAIDELAAAETDAPFDLARGPLARATLIRLAGDDHVILVTFHHIIGDGWSLGVFARELMAHYRAYTQGGHPDLPELPVQYVDYAAWQRGWLRGDAFERQLAYWERQLRNLPVLNLPTDRPRPSVPTFEGAARPFELSPELIQQVHVLGRREGVTPAMFLLAAFQVLLARYSGQDDVVVGSPIANRVHPDLENLIGFFVNTLVLRADLSGDPTFVEVLRRIRSTSLGAYDHQDLPFERLVDEIEPDRDVSRNPLFQVAFMLQNMPRVDLDLQGLTLAQAPLHIRTVRVDLELHLFEIGEGIQGRAIYSTDLFDETTIDRMLRHYVQLLESAVAAPDARVSAMALLEEDERRRLVVDWNETEQPFASQACIHELFEARVAEAPNAVAVVAGDVELTYAELNARANQVAHTLRARGVGPDTLVGLCTDRSPDMVVGLLGILKSGGAYLPLDPTYPRERLAFMLEDSGAAVLLTQEPLLDALPDRAGLTLCLDRDRPTFAEAPEQNPALVTRPEHVAYAIYTSGSTGRPKGALVAHRGLVSLSGEQARAFGAGPGSRVLQFSSLSFDASSFEVVMALPKGATLVLGHREELLPGPDLLRFIRERRISIVTLPPTALAALPVEDLPDLKTITVAGEACSADLVSRWAPGRKFFNLYGPTEATIWSTMAELRPGEAAHIGRPIGNVRVYVLDAHGRVVPVGVPGELSIGGVSVARGYLNRPALTADRFVPDPFGGAAGARLYRSGDLVRYRADGNLEFLGRIDEQVKLRGFRIELGEIESVLDEHPAVRESVAMVREDVADDRRLVAYVRCDEDVELVSPETDASGWQDDHVTYWQTLYDQSYAEYETPAEAAFNIAGWNSSYTGDPIPADEMREWVENTVARIRSIGPERVLEMGCGTGLLLLRLVPHCTDYVGADFSQSALDYVAQQLDRMGDDGAKARLECRTADDYDGLPGGHFDTVVLNSVVQYFPSAAYLRQVLEGAVSRVRPGGRIFVGDVRSLPLLEAFHASVQLERAPDETTREQLRLRVHHEMNQDQELVIDPSFFTTLAADIDGISHVELEPKRGRYDNELSRFRYDVVVHVGDGGAEAGAAPLTWRTWDDASMTLPRLLAQLEEERPSTLAFSDVPNRRVADDVEIAALLEREECPTTPDALREHLDGSSHRAHGVEPDELRVAGETLGYDVFVSVGGGRSDGSFDVVLARRADAVPSERIWRSMPGAAGSPDGAEATNRPLRGRFLRELVPHLRQHASARLPEYMVPPVFTVLDTFPLTPNGKVDRRALPAPDALRPELRVAYEPPRSALEETLARIWVQVLGVDRVGAHDNFFELGGDSMLSIQVVALAREAGVGISARDLFQHQTVAELAAAAGATVVTAEQGVVTGDVPLTPIASWFFEQDFADAHHFNQAVMLTADHAFDVDQLEAVLAHLVTHHDALRLRARHAADGWTLTLAAPGDPVPVEVVDLSTVPAEEQPALVEREAARVQASLDLGAGPLIRCAVFRGGAAPNGGAERLLITIHHLAVDVVSWGVLLEDLARGLEQQRAGQSVSLPAKTTSIREWATRLDEHAQRAEVAEQAAYWLDLPWSKAATLPVDDAQGENTIESVRSAPAVLDEQQTRAVLHEVPAAFNATVEEVLLAALAMACAAETNGAWTLVDLEGHGREEFADDVDVSRTVGWFTSIHPVLLHAEPGAGAGPVLRTVKEQLRAVPGHGMPFGMGRYLARDPAVSRGLNALPQARIAFNYLGRLDRMTARAGWDVSTQGAGPSRSPRGRRRHLLEVSGAVLQGRLRMGFGYSTAVHREATIVRLADRYSAALLQLIEASRSGEESGYTESDLAEVGWSADDVEELLDEM